MIDRIIVDTSSIAFAFSNRIDIFRSLEDKMPGYKVLISSGIINELKRISKSGRKEGRYAKIALMVIGRCKPEIEKSSLNVDKWIIEESAKGGKMVCTNDMRLKRILRSKGIPAFSVTRGGSFR